MSRWIVKSYLIVEKIRQSNQFNQYNQLIQSIQSILNQELDGSVCLWWKIDFKNAEIVFPFLIRLAFLHYLNSLSENCELYSFYENAFLCVDYAFPK